MRLRWPFTKAKLVAWYDEPGYLHLPPDKEISIVQWDNTTQQDMIVNIKMGHVSIYTNRGTYLNQLLAEVYAVAK